MSAGLCLKVFAEQATKAAGKANRRNECFLACSPVAHRLFRLN
jgi:hypothetical protein